MIMLGAKLGVIERAEGLVYARPVMMTAVGGVTETAEDHAEGVLSPNAVVIGAGVSLTGDDHRVRAQNRFGEIFGRMVAAHPAEIGADVLGVASDLWKRLALNVVALVALEVHEELATARDITAGGQRELPAARHSAHLVQLLHCRPPGCRARRSRDGRALAHRGLARRGLARRGLARRGLAVLMLGTVLVLGVERRHEGTDDDQGEEEAHRQCLLRR